MAVVLNERVVLMLVVEPAIAVMVISQGATRADGNEEAD
jgi:hypothetical protein